MCLLLNPYSKIYQFEIPQLAKYWSIWMNIHEKTCNVKLYGHIITAKCSIRFVQNTTSNFHATEYKFSSFFNRIAWHQIHHFIIKVQRVKIGNILSEVIEQWRSQVITQVTWEKMWYSSSATLSSQNTQRRNSRGLALNLPVSTLSGRILHLNFASADLYALLITHST